MVGEDAGRDRSVEQPRDRVIGQVGHRREHALVELDSEHGRGRERRLRIGAEHHDAVPDQVAQRWRHVERHRRRQRDDVIVDVELAGTRPVSEQVIGEQGVPGGLGVQPIGDGSDVAARGRGDPFPHQIAQVRGVEAAELDAHRVVAGQVGQRNPELVVRGLAGVAEPGQHQHQGVSEIPHEMPEQVQRRGLGPVQVIEHQHQGSDGRGAPDDVDDGLEQSVSSRALVAVGRRWRGDAPLELREQPKQIAATRGRVRVEGVVRQVVDDPTHHLRERLERHGDMLVATAVEHVPT